MPSLATAHATTPRADGRYLVLFDGKCAFCNQQKTRLKKWYGEALVTRDFQQPGALEDLPGVTYEACMDAMQVVTPAGAVYSGAEAVARLLISKKPFGFVAWGYYVPGVRQLADLAYRTIARRRYKLAVKQAVCDGTTCHMPR